MKQIIQGYKKFKEEYFNKNRELFDHLIQNGQQPETLVIACSDSRVDPAIVTKALPGELFVIRNVANLVPPYEDGNANYYHGTSAALEFGVCQLNIKHIIIFGHSRCGGMQSLFTQQVTQQENSFLAKWLELATPAFNKVNNEYPEFAPDVKADLCSKHSIINSLNNLKTFPWIKSRIENQTLNIHGWYFDITNGTTKYWQENNGFIDL